MYESNEGAISGIELTTPDDNPVPTALTALTRKSYEVPLVSPVTLAEAVVEVPSENVSHFEAAMPTEVNGEASGKWGGVRYK